MSLRSVNKKHALLAIAAVSAVVVAGWTVEAQQVAQTSAESELATHPLDSLIRYGNAHIQYIRKNVRDYSCRLIKRERLKGKLQNHQFADMKVRCEFQDEAGNEESLAVFMQFVAPADVKDRRVLFVADQNEGKVLVRKGGKLMKHLKLKVDPFSDRARTESRNNITEISFDKLIERIVEQSKNELKIDPEARNTQVTHFQNAIVNKRKCTHIQIVHPEFIDGLQYHMVSLYIDDELHVPLRLVAYGWPESEGEKPPVEEEYTYLNLRLNIGLTEDDFSESLLEEPKLSLADEGVGTALR